MPVNEFQHTTAAEQRRFIAMSPAEQLLEIWLNAKETNGRVGRLEDVVADHDERLDAIDVITGEGKARQLRAAAVEHFLKSIGGRFFTLAAGIVGITAGVTGAIWAVIQIVSRIT